jgi:signal transduction histidine kinase/CheY-like chemotaxis protein
MNRVGSFHLAPREIDAEQALAPRRRPRLLSWLVAHAGLSLHRTNWQRYGTAFISVAIAMGLRTALDPFLQDRVAYGFFLVATAFTAWRCGLGPALATVAGGAILGNYFFEAPRGSLLVEFGATQMSLLICVIIGVATALFCESLRLTAIENARLYRLAQQADARKDEFVAMLAHELRNPMAPLRNALYLLDAIGSHPPKVEELHRLIGTHVGQLCRLVDDLLDVSRITLGKIELQIERVELRKVVDSAVSAVRPLIDEKHHELHVKLPNEKVLIEADPIRMTQVLTNLLNNAAKYSEPSGRIWLSAEVEHDWVVLRVRDAGIGLTAEECSRVFNLFEQTQRTIEQSKGGLGIGLALVRSLVEMHGGTVAAQSPGANLGSEFVVRLPLHSVPAPVEVPSERPSSAHVTRTGDRRSLRILVVDDVAAAASSMASILRLWKHETKICSDGFSALEAIRTYKPDVLLADLGLPRMSGFQLAEQVRRLPEMHDLILVAVSGFGQPADRERSREAGFSLHLTKPIDPGELERFLDQIELAKV